MATYKAKASVSTLVLDRMQAVAADDRGSTATMFGLLVLPAFLMLGCAVDYGRVVSVRAAMQSLTDAAALAGGKAAQINSSTIATSAQSAAQSYFNATTPTYVVQKSLSSLTLDSTQTQFTWTSSAWVKTPFLSVGGLMVNKPASGDAPTGCAGSWWVCQKVTTTTTTIIANSGQNSGYSIETSFMLDITGSMGDSTSEGITKLQAAKDAANSAIDILIWADQSQQTSKIAIVPFAQDVRLPTASAYQTATGVAAATTTKSIYGYTFSRKSTEYCVGERQGSDKYLDTAPGTNNSYSVAEWDYASSGQAQCNVPLASAMQPLTTDKTTLHNIVNGLQTAGSTSGHIGMQWAWYMLSPNWKTLWNNTNCPADYDTAYNVNTKVGDPKAVKLKKIAILMTDGDFNTQDDGNGIITGWFNDSPANAASSTQATQVCTNMKTQGIEVYTVAFSAAGGLSSSAKTLLQNCATDSSHFYDAANATAITAAFRDIALKIATLRIMN